MIEQLKARLFYVFPHHLLSRAIYWLTRLETAYNQPVMRWFIRHFDVDMSEAETTDLSAYSSFNAFFTRSLKADARPINSGAKNIICPADGRISQLGKINRGRILQAKGQHYTVTELLGGSEKRAAPYFDGTFCTIYLSPRDYHRVHMPLDGLLTEMVHIPGRLFSVAPYTTRVIPRLFARNERVASLFETDFASMAMVLVGAVNVAAIETVWAGLVTPPKGKEIAVTDYPTEMIHLKRGQEMGRFNMGSTVILLFPPGMAAWDANLSADDAVKMGQRLGVLS